MRLLLAVVLPPALFLLASSAYLRRAPAGPVFPAPLAAVELSRGGSTLTLTRDAGGAWRVAPPGDLADGEAAARLAAGLEALTLGERIAEPGAAAAYGLGAGDAVRVRGKAADGRAGELTLGRRALGETLHALDPAGRGVRLARGVDPALLARGGEQWLERRLLPGGCPRGAVVTESGRPPYRVGPGDRLCRVAAVGFDPPAASVFGGFESPRLSVRAEGGGSWRLGARLGRSERAAKVEGRDVMLRVRWDD